MQLRRRGDHTPTLRFEDYEAIGGVGGAVTRSADELLHSLTPTQQQAARRMLLELVHPGRGVRDVRKTATREELLAAGGAEAEGVLLRLSGGAKEGPSAPRPAPPARGRSIGGVAGTSRNGRPHPRFAGRPVGNIARLAR